MTSGRLRRFLKLERPRPERAAEDGTAPSTAERFGGVERPRASPERPRTSGARLDRFGPEPDPPIELVETSAQERPFTRCMRCGRDHNIFAVECDGCSASLDTAAQREFNELLWAERQEEAAREARHAAEREELRCRAQAEAEERRRAMGEELAREVGERERRRLGGWEESDLRQALAFRVLALFPDPATRLAVAAAGAGVLVVLAVVGLAVPSARPALYAALTLAILLFVPPCRRRRWWW